MVLKTMLKTQKDVFKQCKPLHYFLYKKFFQLLVKIKKAFFIFNKVFKIFYNKGTGYQQKFNREKFV